MIKLPYDYTDILFRALFSMIFLALGMEHILDDHIIQSMMPDWLVYKRPFSIAAGFMLLLGGFSVLLGYKSKLGASLLGLFLLTVTITIHGPALVDTPEGLPDNFAWLWQVYQRSNFVKNLCLLGVCLQLTNHQVGRFSLEHFLTRQKKA